MIIDNCPQKGQGLRYCKSIWKERRFYLLYNLWYRLMWLKQLRPWQSQTIKRLFFTIIYPSDFGRKKNIIPYICNIYIFHKVNLIKLSYNLQLLNKVALFQLIFFHISGWKRWNVKIQVCQSSSHKHRETWTKD